MLFPLQMINVKSALKSAGEEALLCATQQVFNEHHVLYFPPTSKITGLMCFRLLSWWAFIHIPLCFAASVGIDRRGLLLLSAFSSLCPLPPPHPPFIYAQFSVVLPHQRLLITPHLSPPSWLFQHLLPYWNCLLPSLSSLLIFGASDTWGWGLR